MASKNPWYLLGHNAQLANESKHGLDVKSSTINITVFDIKLKSLTIRLFLSNIGWVGPIWKEEGKKEKNIPTYLLKTRKSLLLGT